MHGKAAGDAGVAGRRALRDELGLVRGLEPAGRAVVARPVRTRQCAQRRVHGRITEVIRTRRVQDMVEARGRDSFAGHWTKKSHKFDISCAVRPSSPCLGARLPWPVAWAPSSARFAFRVREGGIVLARGAAEIASGRARRLYCPYVSCGVPPSSPCLSARLLWPICLGPSSARLALRVREGPAVLCQRALPACAAGTRRLAAREPEPAVAGQQAPAAVRERAVGGTVAERAVRRRRDAGALAARAWERGQQDQPERRHVLPS